jgi:predicted TIM-barrel fold metal-dependent hydrolase
MIIDAHVHISSTGHPAMKQPAFTAEELLAQMDGPHVVLGAARRVDWALAQPHPHDTIYESDILAQHQYLVQAVTAYPHRLAGCMVANPRLGVGGCLDALRVLVDQGVRAVKLHPGTHAYYPDRALHRLQPLLEFISRQGLLLIVHTGDPPFAQPVQVAPLAEAFPACRIVLAHLGTQQVSYANQAIYVARRNANIFLETGWGTLPRLRDAVLAIGSKRLLHATDCPILEMGSQLRLLEVLTYREPFGVRLADRQLEDILGNNAARLLGLS